MKYIIYTLLLLFTLQSCGEGSENYDEESIDGYEDGTYCAEVEYYNPNTGTSNTYTLEVEVYNNKVTQINFGNGGWMDEDHFSAEQLDSYGTCSFTSDKGYEYTVTIIGTNCGSTDELSFQNDVEEDDGAVICPNCGGEKDDYAEICDDCESDIAKQKDIEEHTCYRCGEYDYSIYYSGDLCSDCKRDDEEENN